MHRRSLLAPLILTGLLGYCLIIPQAVVAQPGWVKNAALQDIGALSHQDADYIVLHSSEDVQVRDNGNAASHFQIAYKVLKTTGIDDVIFAVSTHGWRKLGKVQGWHILPGGKSETLDPGTIVAASPNSGAEMHDDVQVMLTRFEKVTVGSIVAYEYDIEEVGGWVGAYQVFNFQGRQPVKWAQFRVKLPRDWRLQYALTNGDRIGIDSANGAFTWTAADLAYRPSEPLMHPWVASGRSVTINCYSTLPTSKTACFSDWSTAASWVDSIHYFPSQPSAGVTQFVKERTAADTCLDDRLRRVASFVQNEIRYMAIEIGKGWYVPHHSSATLNNRYGDCKDKVALFRALLTSMGIPSNSALALVKGDVAAGVCSPFQFNHCIVAIPDSVIPNTQSLAEAHVGDWILFDPTEPSAPFGFLPRHLHGTNVLIGAPNESSLVQIPPMAPLQSMRQYVAEATLANDGSFIAQVRVVDHGNLAALTSYRRKAISMADRIDSVRAYVASLVPGATVDGYQCGEEGDSAWSTYRITSPTFTQVSGDLTILKLDFLTPAEQPAFKKTERTHPIWFGWPNQTIGEIVWHLPDGWSAESAESLLAECSGARAVATIEPIAGGLKYSVEFVTDGQILPPSEYAAARAFRRDYERLTAAKTVLKTK